MSDVLTTREAADLLGLSPGRTRKVMWNHGFDPVDESHGRDLGGGPTLHWRRGDVDVVLEERHRWGFDIPSVFSTAGRDHWGLAPRASINSMRVGRFDHVPAPCSFDPEAARARREKTSAQLAAAPVAAVDIDYIATRAGERRGSRGLRTGVGPTEHILADTKASGEVTR